MFVEGTADDVLRPGQVDKLRVRGITEGVPEVRLDRILRRNKFVEAEKFAESFGLSKEDIYKRKVAWIRERLSPWSTDDRSDDQVLFDDLKKSLDKIEDIDFVMECCSLAALPSIDMNRQLLVFARQKIGQV